MVGGGQVGGGLVGGGASVSVPELKETRILAGCVSVSASVCVCLSVCLSV